MIRIPRPRPRPAAVHVLSAALERTMPQRCRQQAAPPTERQAAPRPQAGTHSSGWPTGGAPTDGAQQLVQRLATGGAPAARAAASVSRLTSLEIKTNGGKTGDGERSARLEAKNRAPIIEKLSLAIDEVEEQQLVVEAAGKTRG